MLKQISGQNKLFRVNALVNVSLISTEIAGWLCINKNNMHWEGIYKIWSILKYKQKYSIEKK